jgi:hypothetical protein
MSDDFGTVNVRRGERSREIEVLRQHYRTHRDALGRMAGEAPTEHLSAEYHRLIADIDSSLRKLDELEGHGPAPTAAPPGQRPLVAPPADTAGTYDAPFGPSGSSSRIILIVFAGLVVLAAIAWMIWRASSDRRTPERPVVEQPATTTTALPVETGTVVPAVTPVPIGGAASIRVTPAVQDYGIIRRGTRAVRQFELTNTGETSVTIEVARSACRCLYYDYNGKKIAPKARETITVTVDAARAKSSTVDEHLTVTAKEDPSATATIGVRAEIK